MRRLARQVWIFVDGFGVGVGQVLSTNYGSGPYRVTAVRGPCTCPEYYDRINRTLDHPAPASIPHYHLVCKNLDGRDRRKKWLNGYALAIDGEHRNVWSDDQLILEDL